MNFFIIFSIIIIALFYITKHGWKINSLKEKYGVEKFIKEKATIEKLSSPDTLFKILSFL
jgi:hypothetical protein